MTTADVLVAGCGPVGAVLAAMLGERAVSVLVVDPAIGTYPRPRAAGLDEEVLRLLVRLRGMAGLLDEVHPSARATFVGPDRRLLLAAGQGPAELGVPVGAFIHQPSLERSLRAGIADLPSVDVRLGVGVSGLRESPDAVQVDLDDGSVVRARWVVGCDGASSTVRTLIGAGYEGTTFAQPWLVVDARSPGPLPMPADIAFVLDPRRPAVTMPMPGGHRWEWMLLPGEDPARMTRPETVTRLLTPWIDPGTVTIERAAVYTFHARMASRWRVGRVLLAGDAAHTMPPFAGQGLASGIRDAAALAWRLTEVVTGRRDPRTLDDYERERRPQVAAITTRAIRAGRVVQTTSPTRAALLRTTLRTAAHTPGLRQALRSGAARPRTRLPRAARTPRDGGRWAGRVLANPRVRTSAGTTGHLDDLLGLSWALLGLGVDPGEHLPPQVRRWADRHGAAVVTVTGPGRAGDIRAGGPAGKDLVVEDLEGTVLCMRGRHGRARIAVVRPDRYLLGVFEPSHLPNALFDPDEL
ncbi:3-(3-hydroxy-phenyl)propionate hydroxylase [Parafrankia irregularis]|uniref:3-(3-hydroxy-phenyl)propionate hydroxylase n=1 Tax=Parafrankia irregularis TaxID=795642 RepID=A0A0S4QM34_9ACTN|nr:MULTISPECIES: bifunctional 3-(3-hydroxy-phenyl)propionate/3-hydroxycinnamic acid hydroxylase [Parafrankia]MBE3201177.1 bifunctional 3-(3-hydroxy-phenyl)propionate/3-hydroxycinnamic acid hydroxylase [Parafrankia sp. CH37]CUU56388.1 3-(3-hydroxy-phenyl)propionate hydroxylase [Parafrankia irregularis]